MIAVIRATCAGASNALDSISIFNCPTICELGTGSVADGRADSVGDWFPCNASSIVGIAASLSGHVIEVTSPDFATSVSIDGVAVTISQSSGYTSPDRVITVTLVSEAWTGDVRKPAGAPYLRILAGTRVLSVWAYWTHHMPTGYLLNARVDMPPSQWPSADGLCSKNVVAPADFTSHFRSEALASFTSTCGMATADGPASHYVAPVAFLTDEAAKVAEITANAKETCAANGLAWAEAEAVCAGSSDGAFLVAACTLDVCAAANTTGGRLLRCSGGCRFASTCCSYPVITCSSVDAAS